MSISQFYVYVFKGGGGGVGECGKNTLSLYVCEYYHRVRGAINIDSLYIQTLTTWIRPDSSPKSYLTLVMQGLCVYKHTCQLILILFARLTTKLI